ncbi:MAG: hypothetical protein O6952_04605 [Planctomycetota bacterium]|nr:hypothetical protein [Planctomycetota bacterium]
MRRSYRFVVMAMFAVIISVACGGPDKQDDEDDQPKTSPVESGHDYWLQKFEPYITPEFRAAYLATPEKDRFEKFGKALQDFQTRELDLERAGGKLTPAQIAEYRRLPDLAASREFLEKHLGTSWQGPPPMKRTD